MGYKHDGETYDDEVVEPVRARRKRNTFCSQTRRKNLARQTPWDGSPGRAKAEHIEEQESHRDPALGCVVSPAAAELADQHRDDQVADEHESCASEQQWAATETVHSPERGDDANKLGAVDDTGEEQLHLVPLAESTEEARGVVNQGVDSCHRLEAQQIYDCRTTYPRTVGRT